jgi:predicted type IV restriction endonuclease
VLVDALLGTLKECAARIDDFRSHHTQLGEENTKAALIEPVLKALGWDTSNPDEVHHEYRRLSNDNPVDYALLLLRTPRLFLEAKDLWVNLADPKWANQFIAYATAAGVQWVVLTNGAEWRVYNAHAPVPIEQKLFRTVRIDEDLDSAYSVLELLSKDNMREMRIEELWKGFFIDRKVHAALTQLFSGSDPAKEIVSAVRHRDPDLKLSEIRESLARARRGSRCPS